MVIDRRYEKYETARCLSYSDSVGAGVRWKFGRVCSCGIWYLVNRPGSVQMFSI